MKMKKLTAIVVSAVLMASVAATAAFAVESTPSKTGSDADTGETEVTVSGEVTTGRNLDVEVAATEDSAKEETKLKNAGVEGYLGTTTTEAAAKILGTAKNNVTISEIKEVTVSGYEDNMDEVTLKVPFAALPEEGTQVAVVVRVTTPDGQTINLPVAGVVVEETVIVNGVARKVRKVVFTLDATTMVNVQAGKVYVAAVTTK